jgi:hypothetical protein
LPRAGRQAGDDGPDRLVGQVDAPGVALDDAGPGHAAAGGLHRAGIDVAALHVGPAGGQGLAQDRARAAARIQQDVPRLARQADHQGGHGGPQRTRVLGRPLPPGRVSQAEPGDQAAGLVLADPDLDLGPVRGLPPGLVARDGPGESLAQPVPVTRTPGSRSRSRVTRAVRPGTTAANMRVVPGGGWSWAGTRPG